MNLSGPSLQKAGDFYDIPTQRMLVLFDDVSLEPGVLRIRMSGSAGGHNGLKSIIAALGTDEIPRIKIGVGVPPPEAGEQEIINWVLGGFAGKDADIIAETCEKACDALPVLIGEGAEKAMNKFN